MKQKFVTIVLAVFAVLCMAGCSGDEEFVGTAEVKDVVGVVSCHDNVWRIMETKSEAQYYCTDACYYPLNMSSDMKKEGQTVRFSGKTRKVKCKEESELMGCTYYDLVLSSIEVYR